MKIIHRDIKPGKKKTFYMINKKKKNFFFSEK
jgi:hypothetical protein